MNGAVPKASAALRDALRRLTGRISERLTPKQRQYAMLGGILLGGVGLLWLVFASTGDNAKDKAGKATTGTPSAVTNIGVMPPGQQVNPVDQWVGTAGSKLAQYENEREEQGRLNKDRQAFEARTMQRFSELEQRLTSATQAAAMPPASIPAPAAPPPSPSRASSSATTTRSGPGSRTSSASTTSCRSPASRRS